MENKQKIDVFLRFSEQDQLVGRLVQEGRNVLFKYSSDYLENGPNISPKKLRFDDSIQLTDSFPFEGLFGVFADSLPDAWGNLLLRRWLNKNQISPEQLNSLDRLSLVGENGPGALVYKPCEDEENTGDIVDLDALARQMDGIIRGESNTVVDDLFQKGGSPGGARPKIYAGYHPANDELIYGRSDLPSGFEHWLVKFAADVDSTDIASVEMAYHQMAQACGIDVSEAKLLNGKSGKKYFATKRFDRIGNDRLHLHSAAGMFHDDFERSQLDYGTLIHETGDLMSDIRATEQQFRRAAFNVFAHNRDDHSKNFAFLMDSTGKWALAPAFDLTFSSSSQGMHSTTCARNGVNPGSKELMSLATHFSLSNGEKIIQEVKTVIREWKHFADSTGVTSQTAKTIAGRLTEIDN